MTAKDESDLTAGQRILASSSGAVITSLIMTPFDVVKTRLQAQHKEFMRHKCYLYCNGLMEHVCYLRQGEKHWWSRPGRYKGTLDAFVKISAQEGVASLWSGLPPTLIMAVPATALYFTSYDVLKQKLMDTKYFSLTEATLISGAFARTLTVTLISPLELIRTKVQAENLQYTQVLRAVKDLMKVQGARALYIGLYSTLLRDVPFSCLYWSSYERLKLAYGSETPSLLYTIFAGAASGSIAAVITLPFDVIKTHRQIELGEAITNSRIHVKDPFAMFKELHKMGGFSSLFTGLVPRLAKVAPACAVMISSYEYFKAYFLNK